jgi:hypothetical protein
MLVELLWENVSVLSIGGFHPMWSTVDAFNIIMSAETSEVMFFTFLILSNSILDKKKSCIINNWML